MQSNRLARRVEIADQTVRFLQFIKTGIRYSAQPVEQLIAQSAEQFPALQMLRECGTFLDRGLPFLGAWRQALEAFRKESRMESAYIKLAADFGAGFGVTDVEGQLVHCDLYLSRFEERLAEAREQYKRKGRLYILLGGLTGLAAALLIL